MATPFGMFPFLQKLFADGGYQGSEFTTALAKVRPHLNVEIVKRSDRAKGFVVLSKRWIVERTLAWLNRCRRPPRIGRTAIEKRLRFCTSPQFGSCSENSVIRPKVSGQTLMKRLYRELQFLRRAESYLLARFDLNRFAGCWIAAHSNRPKSSSQMTHFSATC